MKTLRIGIMGCLVNSTNLGCVALTYSLLQDLERISKELDRTFEYVIFDELPSQNAITRLCNNLSIDISRVHMGTVGAMQTYNLKGLMRACSKKLGANIKMIADVRKCDAVIDMTGGDSFSDIYGKERFYKQTAAKRLVERQRIPLILGPQTYGPYMDPKVKKYAKKTIEAAHCVLSRDDESKAYVESFCNKKVIAVTDLAFGLRYQKEMRPASNKIRIGLNPSGLLGKNKVEYTRLDNALKTNYDEFIQKLIEELTENEMYEIHLIPHVGNEAIECFSGFKNVIYHEAFKDPMAAKSLISAMDVFIGSRMHAAIGAFSAGVATIPVAYSKKFSGLFNAIGYRSIVDLQTLKTAEAVELTLKYVRNYKVLKKNVIESQTKINERYSVLMTALMESLHEIDN